MHCIIKYITIRISGLYYPLSPIKKKTILLGSNFHQIILCSSSSAAELQVREPCTIKMLLFCWSTSGRPQLQLCAHMAFNAEHSKLPLSEAWQRKGRKKSNCSLHKTQTSRRQKSVEKASDLNSWLFPHFFCAKPPPFLTRSKNVLKTEERTCKMSNYLLQKVFLLCKGQGLFPSSKSAFYLSLYCGPKHTGQHSSLTSRPLSIPNLSGHIPHCCFDG